MCPRLTDAAVAELEAELGDLVSSDSAVLVVRRAVFGRAQLARNIDCLRQRAPAASGVRARGGDISVRGSGNGGMRWA